MKIGLQLILKLFLWVHSPIRLGEVICMYCCLDDTLTLKFKIKKQNKKLKNYLDPQKSVPKKSTILLELPVMDSLSFYSDSLPMRASKQG